MWQPTEHRTALSQSLPGEERLQRRRALVGQHPAEHLGPVGQPAVAHHVPQRARPRRSWVPTPRTPAGRPAPSPARPRTSCTARRSPPASRPRVASRRRAPSRPPAWPGSPRARSDPPAPRGRWPPAPTRCRRARRPPRRSARRVGPALPAASSAARMRSSSVTDRGGRAPPTAPRRSPSPVRCGRSARRRRGRSREMITPSTASGRPTSDSSPRSPSSNGSASSRSSGLDVGVELLEHLGGDVVVQRRGGVRQQQPGACRRGPHDHEELVVDVEQPENGTCAAQFTQLGFGRRQGWSTRRDASAVQRHLPSSRTTATPKPSGASAAWSLRRCPLWSHGRLR